MNEIWCQACKQWLKVPPGATRRGTRMDHNKLCAGDPFTGHPDLLELDADLEYWFGSNK